MSGWSYLRNLRIDDAIVYPQAVQAIVEDIVEHVCHQKDRRQQDLCGEHNVELVVIVAARV